MEQKDFEAQLNAWLTTNIMSCNKLHDYKNYLDTTAKFIIMKFDF